MKEKITKTQFKAFFLPDYEQEEKYLSDMHRDGWKLKRAYPYFYTFERCTPENVVYKIDFGNTSGDKTAYINMFDEYGWEYIQKLNNFYYFRRPAEGLSEEELEIFSDNESRLKMVQKIIKRLLLPVLILFAIGMLNLCTLILKVMKFATPDRYAIPIILIIILYMVLFSIVIHCYTGLKRLKRKFEKRE